jgi:hypothetical protein
MLIWWKKNRITFEPMFFLWQNFAKFQLENYDFDLFKGFSMEKMAQIFQILKNNVSKSLDFMLSFSR